MNTETLYNPTIHQPITDKMVDDFDTITECIKHLDNNSFTQVQTAILQFRKRYPEFSSNADELQRKLTAMADAFVVTSKHFE